nr:hypothetical protein [uncultured Pseudogulbenkiania sp.]
MTLTYTVADGGYKIYRDGELWIDQPHRWDVPGNVPGNVPYATDAEAEAAALDAIAANTPAA